MEFIIHPLQGGFGAELWGLDLSKPISDALFEEWRAAFEKYSVLTIPGQTFTTEQQIEFSKRFGPLEPFPDEKDQVDGEPTVIRVSNIDRDSGAIKPVDDPGHKSFTLGTSGWHTDSSYRRIPSHGSLLYAVEVPPKGGDTLFANTRLAYEALPEEKKSEIDNLVVVHDFETTRRRFGLPPRPNAVRKATPPVRQPMVRTLPDGGKALLLGIHADYVEDMDQADSQALLEEMIEWATQPQFVYRHRWRVGDLVMWDNRCTLHKAGPYDLANDRRLLHRTTVAGDGPVI